jgi:uncharacterized protein (DUF58 family)
MTLPTPRAVLFFGLSVPIALLIISVRSDLWHFSLYYPCTVLALMASDLISALPSGLLSAELRHPAQLYVGRQGGAELDVRVERYDRPVVIRALLEQTGCADEPAAVTGEISDSRLVLPLVITPRRRGRLGIDAVWLRWRGPLGLVEIRERRKVGRVIDVVPDIKGIHDEALRFFSREAEYGIKQQMMRGEGTEFEDLREYEPGMDHRRIDWNRSARHRKILCKEFRQERNHHVVLGFDTGRLMLEPLGGAPRLDCAIKAGLLLGWVSLHNGDFLGGGAFDVRFRGFIEPRRGMPYFARFQRFAADLAYRTEETNFTLGVAELNSRLTHRALVVLFTEFVDMIQAELLMESLGWMTRRHVVIFVTMRDPMLYRIRDAVPDNFSSVAEAVIADDFLNERSVVLERVARMGVHCVDVPSDGLSSALLNRYLLIKGRGLL